MIKKRPAESGTAFGAVAFLVARALGVDNDETITALAFALGFAPAAITWLVVTIKGK